ncbi:fibropellin-3-like [Saccostrea cucullata]|uniref:fibropellin-3-like n=1 Tax=Saccostrea cuccullata TaxID=36930 RepID=UPI002ED1A543
MDINECAGNPCINGGTCHNLINRYSCSCIPGYYGTHCELDKDECASNPCMHDGTCHNLIVHAMMDIKDHDVNMIAVRYLHFFILLDINECASNPCYNGGTCHDLRNNFTCSCLDGYYGPVCELGNIILL